MGGQQSVPIEGAPVPPPPLDLSPHPHRFCFVCVCFFAEQIFNMKFTAKQLNKLSQKQEKESLQVKLGA